MPFYVRNPTAMRDDCDRQMVVINDKLPPPPPYHTGARHPHPHPHPQAQLAPPPFRTRRACRSLVQLPQHVLLQIVYATCPDDIPPDRLRRRLYWVAMYLRLTSRALYTGESSAQRETKIDGLMAASMHLLRSTYLPLYIQLIKPPYSSDPFPLTAPSSSSSLSLQSAQRETAILDKFLVLKICDDVRADETQLHLGSDDAFTDVFELMQPRSRVEDLVRVFGTQVGVVCVQEDGAGSVSARRARATKLPFETLSVNFSPRKVSDRANYWHANIAQVSLVQTDHTRRKRTLVEIQRTKSERLEVSAKRLIRALIANGIVPEPCT